MEHYERESGHNTVFIQIALSGEMLPTVTSLASPRIYNCHPNKKVNVNEKNEDNYIGCYF
jgi:hypothetical protein